MSRRFIGWSLAAVIVLLLFMIFRASPQEPTVVEEFRDKPSLSKTARAPEVFQEPDNEATMSRANDPRVTPHPSLQGTDVNGRIRIDQDGHVVHHRDVRRLFDYYLSLRGRVPPDEIRALIQEHLTASASRQVMEEVLALFDKYVSLIEAEVKMADNWTQSDLNAASQVETILAERRHLRREHLGDNLAEAFFLDQENYEAYQLERMKISTNSNLTKEQKAAALEAAEIILTPEQREIRKQTFAWLDIKKIASQPVESLDAESADAIRQRFGENALDRLAAVEQERRTWEQKRQDYLAEKARLQSRGDLSEDEKNSLLMDYAKAHLDAGEQRRMQALDSDQAAL